VPLFAEPAGINASARQHARNRQAKENDARKERELNRLGQEAQRRAEDEALEHAVDLLSSGKGIPGLKTRTLAVRALERRGGETLSSAEQHAARYMARNRPDHDQDHDPTRDLHAERVERIRARRRRQAAQHQEA
jgi:hypothetical protein